MKNIGEYQVIKSLGDDWSAFETFIAIDPKINKKVFIRILYSSCLERYSNKYFEILETLSINHPNIVQCENLGIHQQRPYYKKEYIKPCKTLVNVLRQHKMLGEGIVLKIAMQMLRALLYAYQQCQFLHTYLSPSYIYLEREKDCLIKIDGFDVWWETEKNSSIRTPTCLGTPPYVAPEVILEQSTHNQQTVIYAVGAILFECLTGRPIFIGNNSIETMNATITKETPTISEHNPYVSPQIQDLVKKMVAKEPCHRYHNFSEVLCAWEKIKQ